MILTLAALQVDQMVKATPAATCLLPLALLKMLISSTVVVAALRSEISGATFTDAPPPHPAWTADVAPPDKKPSATPEAEVTTSVNLPLLSCLSGSLWCTKPDVKHWEGLGCTHMQSIL